MSRRVNDNQLEDVTYGFKKPSREDFTKDGMTNWGKYSKALDEAYDIVYDALVDVCKYAAKRDLELCPADDIFTVNDYLINSIAQHTYKKNKKIKECKNEQ